MKKTFTLYALALVTICCLNVLTSCKKGDTPKVDPDVIDSLKIGLLAYYPFNNSGVDESGNGNNGLVYNITGTTDRNGKANAAYYFDGFSSYVQVKDNQALRLNNTDYTVNVWIKMDAYSSSYGSDILSKRGLGSVNGYLYGIHGYAYGSGGVVGQTTFQLSGGSDPFSVGVKIINTNTWYMLTTIYNLKKQQMSFYINGILDNVINNIPTPNAASNADIYIGSDNPIIGTSGYYYRGSIDDMRIYNRVLTPIQIKTLYALTY